MELFVAFGYENEFSLEEDYDYTFKHQRAKREMPIYISHRNWTMTIKRRLLLILPFFQCFVSSIDGIANVSAGEIPGLNPDLREHPVLTGKMPASGFIKWTVDNKMEPNKPPFYLPEDQVVQKFEGAWENGNQGNFIVKETTWQMPEPTEMVMGYCMGKEDGVVWYAERHNVGYYLPNTNGEPNIEGLDVVAARTMLREALTLEIAALATNWSFTGLRFQGVSSEGERLEGDVVLDGFGYIAQVNISNSRGKWVQANYDGWRSTELGHYPTSIQFVTFTGEKDSKGRIAKAWSLDEIRTGIPKPREGIPFFSAAYHVKLSKVGRIEWQNGIAYFDAGTNRMAIVKAPEKMEVSARRSTLLILLVVCSITAVILALLKNHTRPFTSANKQEGENRAN